jgi:hypothetical protein
LSSGVSEVITTHNEWKQRFTYVKGCLFLFFSFSCFVHEEEEKKKDEEKEKNRTKSYFIILSIVQH